VHPLSADEDGWERNSRTAKVSWKSGRAIADVEGYALTRERLAAKRGPLPLLRLASDERLVALTRSGHQGAFEMIVARYQVRLLSFCARIVGSREDAEDVLQEVFAAAYNALLADAREIHLRPWLYRIARNRSLNHLRRRSAIGVDSMDVHFAEMGISTSDKVFKREEFKLLLGDIGGLPETQRTALLLRELEGMSYEQIALAMDQTVPGIKSLLVRARVGLAEASEARELSCDAVRVELGEVAEGIARLSAPTRRHLESCERCASFRGHLRASNRALAGLAPIAPLLAVKQLLLSKLGLGGGGAAGGGAAAGGAAVAGGGAATLTATAVTAKVVATVSAAAVVAAGAAVVVHSHARHAHQPLPLTPPVLPQSMITASATASATHHARRHAAVPSLGASIALPAAPAASATTGASGTTSEEVTTTTVFPGGGPTGISGSSPSATATAPAVAPASTGATAASGSSGVSVGVSVGSTGTSVSLGASGPRGY
jgi:RNA polymerase sigma factor (sigma-70 family)